MPRGPDGREVGAAGTPTPLSRVALLVENTSLSSLKAPFHKHYEERRRREERCSRDGAMKIFNTWSQVAGRRPPVVHGTVPPQVTALSTTTYPPEPQKRRIENTQSIYAAITATRNIQHYIKKPQPTHRTIVHQTQIHHSRMTPGTLQDVPRDTGRQETVMR